MSIAAKSIARGPKGPPGPKPRIGPSWAAAPSAFAALARADRAAALRTALDRLPDRQRLAIVLRHLEERGNPEIAAILGVSVEAVESLLARGRRELASRLLPRRADLELDHGDT